MGEGTESACGASLLLKLHFRVPLLRRILAHPKYGMCLLSVCVLMRVHVRVPECSAHRGQKRTFDHLELEHQILVLCKGSAELSLQPHGILDRRCDKKGPTLMESSCFGEGNRGK